MQATHASLERGRSMFQLAKRIIGRPLLRRSRRLAQVFSRATKRADEVQRPAAGTGRTPCRQSVRPRPSLPRDQVPGRLPAGAADSRLTALEPDIERVRQGDVSALFGRGTKVLMFAMTSGTTNQPKTIPVTEQSLSDYREGWTIWGILAFDAHPEMIHKGLKPILKLPATGRELHPRPASPAARLPG